MTEALKKVEMRNIQKKNFSQLARTNPTLAALNIVTRKELKMEELHEKYEQEDQKRHRHKSGSSSKDDAANNQSIAPAPAVNSGVLQTFRELSIHKGSSSSSQNSASRQAAIAAKKASTPVKPDIGPKPSSSNKEPEPKAEEPGTPVVVLRKQPRILNADELKARTSSGTGQGQPQGNTVAQDPQPTKIQSNKESSSVQEHSKAAAVTPIPLETSSPQVSSAAKASSEKINLSLSSAPSLKDSPSVKRAVVQTFQDRKQQSPKPAPSSKPRDERVEKVSTQSSNQSPTLRKTSERTFQPENKPQPVKDERTLKDKAIEKLNAAKEMVKQHKGDSPKSVKQCLEGMVHVKPKETLRQAESSEAYNNDNTPKMVKRAAEKFEANLTEQNSKEFSSNSLNLNTIMRGRSKSISNRLREQMEDSNKNVDMGNKSSQALPWSGKSPPVIRRRDASRNNKGKRLKHI